MKLVVFSDAHGYKEIVERIVNFNSDADYFISLGDSELEQDFLLSNDIIMIKGNYPRDPGFVYEREMEVEGLNFFLIHGHKYGVQRSLKKLIKHTINNNYDVVLYGHTHIADVMKVGKALILNPGSCARPRNDVAPSYLVIEIIEGVLTYNYKESFTNSTIEV